MPGLNKTGPNGEGPMTGRKMGTCVENANAGQQNVPPAGFGLGFGRGLGRGGGGRGRGRGFRNVYRATGLTGWQRDEQKNDQS